MLKIIYISFVLTITLTNISLAVEATDRIVVRKIGKSLSFKLNKLWVNDFTALATEMSKYEINEDVDVYFDDNINFRDFNNLRGFFDAYGVENVNFYCVNWKTRKMSNVMSRWPVSNIPNDLDK